MEVETKNGQGEEVARRLAVRANISLVKPLDKVNARPKSCYSPPTIARHILLVCFRSASHRESTKCPSCETDNEIASNWV
jgi:hypothetical protein